MLAVVPRKKSVRRECQSPFPPKESGFLRLALYDSRANGPVIFLLRLRVLQAIALGVQPLPALTILRFRKS